MSLGLECYGYGPKPQWMDNGLLQKGQASEIKRVVQETKSKKRGRQLFPETQLEPGFLSPIPTAFNSTQHITTWNDSLTPGEFSYTISGLDINSMIGHSWNASLLNSILTTESPHSQECYMPATEPETADGMNLGPNSLRSGSSEEVATLTPRSPSVNEVNTEWVNIVPQKNVQVATNERISIASELTGGISQGISGNIDDYVSLNHSSLPCLVVSDVCGQSMHQQSATGNHS